MKSKIRNVTQKVLQFLTLNFPMLLFYGIVITLPAVFGISRDGDVRFFWGRVPACGIQAFIVSFGLMTLRGLLLIPKRGFLRYVAGFVTTLCVICSFSEIWMIFSLQSRLSDRMFRLLIETNPREAAEFLEGSFFNLKSLGIAIGYLLFVLMIYRVMKLWQKSISEFLAHSRSNKVKAVTISIALICIAGILADLTIQPWIMNHDNTLERFRKVAQVTIGLNQNIHKLEESIPNADGSMDSSADRPTRIIWILGESDARHHSSLYGYALPTVPKLQEQFDKGNLIVYSDVISFVPWTSNTMEVLFSPAFAFADEDIFYSTPMTPIILRKAGYKVRLFDNQTSSIRIVDEGDLSGNFMSSQILSKACFDFRSDEISVYDGDFLKKYLPAIRHTDGPTLDIIHLYGQHFMPQHRYPGNMGYFTAEDYKFRKELTPDQKQFLAYYDNAVRYGDSLMGNLMKEFEDEDVVMVYFPDHGELIYDEDDRRGRNIINYKGKYIPYYLEIPMYIFTTPRFRESHPELYARLLSGADKKFSTAFFSQFLLDLAGVNSRYADRRYSPISPEWASPKRPFWLGSDYDDWKQNN